MEWDGIERRQSHNCIQEENIGMLKEFMRSIKGVKTTLLTIALTIFLQVGAFIYFWGGMSITVAYHDKTIEKILTKLDKVSIIEYVEADNGKEK